MLKKDVTAADVNAAMKAAAEGPLKGILSTTPTRSSPATSSAMPHSSIFDCAVGRRSIGGNLVKVLSWYDNEYGYSNRTADLMLKIASL